MAPPDPPNPPNLAWKQLADELKKLNAHLEALNAPTILGRLAAERKIFERKIEPITGDPSKASTPPKTTSEQANYVADAYFRANPQERTRQYAERVQRAEREARSRISNASQPEPEPPTEEMEPEDNASRPDRAAEMAAKRREYRRMTGKQRRANILKARREGGLRGALQEYIVSSNYADAAAPPYGHEDDTGLGIDEPGTPSSRASVGGGGGGRGYDPVGERNIPPGMEGMDLNRIANEGFTMPRFGEFTIQDKMRIARDWAGRRALLAKEGSGTEAFFGMTSGLLNKGVNNAAQIHAAHAEARRIWRMGQGVSARGEELGFSPGAATIGTGNIGFRAPWSTLPLIGSEAAREGWDQWWDKQRLRMRPGINSSQAGEIVNVTRQLGYSGDRADDIMFKSLAPLVQEGQEAENVAPLLDAATRLGATSLEEFTETMSGLGEVAQSTRQTLADTQQAMADFAQTAQQHGATYGQGLSSGRGFMASTGMSAQVGSRMMDHDLTQALAFQKYGLLPSQVGLLPGGEMANLTLDTINMGMRMAAPTAQEREIRTPYGTTKISARDAQIAASTQFTGLTADETKRFLRNQKEIRAAATAENVLQGNEQAVKDINKDIRAENKRTREAVESTHRPSLTTYMQGGKPPTGERKKYTEAEFAILQSENSTDEIQSNREVLKALDEAGVKDKTLKKLEELGTSKDLDMDKQKKFTKEARRALEEQTGKLNTEEPDVYIGFTGPAKKWLQQTDSKGNPIKDAANSGGPSLALNAIGAMSPQNAASTMAKAAASLLGG